MEALRQKEWGCGLAEKGNKLVSHACRFFEEHVLTST